MKKFIVMIIVSAACAVGVAGTAGQAKATGGIYYAYNPCPVTAPYLHTNVFGMSYCSIYP